MRKIHKPDYKFFGEKHFEFSWRRNLIAKVRIGQFETEDCGADSAGL